MPAREPRSSSERLTESPESASNAPADRESVPAIRSIPVERRLAFLELTQAELELLTRLRPAFEAHADGFVAAFYRHLLSFEETRSLLVDPAVKRRLLERQRAYLLSLTEGTITEAYVAERRRLGETHVRVGLDICWYLSTYALYMSLIAPIIFAECASSPGAAERTLVALQKRLMLDAQLAMEAYVNRREEQLAYLNRELEQAGREMRQVYARQTDQLRETSARARAAEELASVGALIAGLAHEIGTPMGVIQGHAELLESSVGDERGRWRLATIRQQIDRIANIIQTLLNMARRHERESALLELGSVVERSLAFLSERLRKHCVIASFESDVRAIVVGDAEKLQQLFLNLFFNAVDAMPNGGTLAVCLRPARRGRIEVSVSDSGFGMAEAVRARVFEPFFTTKTAGHGSGLGLMVVEGIVRDHDGTIAVESEPGRGTTFRIELPVKELKPRAGSPDAPAS
jgi:signal transduction histidine kinase